VEPNEIDIALDELEQRVERLRSLYEQYFLGIEKVEPTIARKDVDRRFWILRRTKLRNTARRFRMQLLVQRYNTFQQYWMRICRQIEAGTYIRHVLRAEKKFGKEAVTIKARRREEAMNKARELAAATRKPSQSEMETVAGDSVPPASGADAAGPPSSGGLSAKPTVTIAAVRIPAARPVAEVPPVEARPRPKRIPREEPEDAEIEIHETPVPPATFYNKPTTKLPAIPAAGRGENIGRHLPPAPASTRFTDPPQVSMTPMPGSATRFSIPAAHTPARSPIDKATTVPQLRVTPAASAPQSGAGALSAQRVQELHAQLSAEKKRLADDNPVSLDGLTKSLNETAAKLKSMHGTGKQVDFRVVVKGGKAMVKPVLK
jgi:hypothetical protein